GLVVDDLRLGCRARCFGGNRLRLGLNRGGLGDRLGAGDDRDGSRGRAGGRGRRGCGGGGRGGGRGSRGRGGGGCGILSLRRGRCGGLVGHIAVDVGLALLVRLENGPPRLVDRVLIGEVPRVHFVDEPLVGSKLIGA